MLRRDGDIVLSLVAPILMRAVCCVDTADYDPGGIGGIVKEGLCSPPQFLKLENPAAAESPCGVYGGEVDRDLRPLLRPFASDGG